MEQMQIWLIAGFVFQTSIAVVVAGVLAVLWQARRVAYLAWGSATWWLLSVYFAASGFAFEFVVRQIDSPGRDAATFLTQFGAVAHGLLLIITVRALLHLGFPRRRAVWSGLAVALLAGALSTWLPATQTPLSPERILLRNTLPGMAFVVSYAYALYELWHGLKPRSVGAHLLTAALGINVIVIGAQVVASLMLLAKQPFEMSSTFWYPLTTVTQAIFGLGWVVLLLETEGADRAAAEEQLARANRMLLAAIEASDDLIGVVDAQGRLVLCNSRMASTIQAVTGKKVATPMEYPRPGQTEDERQSFFATIERALGGERVQARNELRTQSGQRLVLDRRIVPIRENNAVTGAFVMARDVTSAEALREEAERAMRIEAMARMAGGLAHDFNNILTVVQTNLQLIAEDRDHDDEVMDILTETGAALNRANVLTRRLLGVARDRPALVARTDLSALLRDFTRFMQHAVGDEIRLVMQIPAVPAVVMIDAGRLEQVLLNLALNARDAMPRGGTLRVTLRDETIDDDRAARYLATPGRYITITVEDEGSGMDEATLKRAGDPFFSTKPGGAGSGLGLATCRALVSEARGTLAIESVPAKGTTVTVLLPPAEENAAE